MAILTAIRPGAPHLRAMVALSLATKVRWLPPVARAMAAMLDAEAGTLAALLEWADTGIILAWTVGVVCRYHRTARLELVAPSAGVLGAGVLGAEGAAAAFGAEGEAGAAGAAGEAGEAGAAGPGAAVALLRAGLKVEGEAEVEVEAEGEGEGKGEGEAAAFVPVAHIAHGVLLLYFGTLFYCLYLYVAEGRSPKHGALQPYLYPYPYPYTYACPYPYP